MAVLQPRCAAQQQGLDLAELAVEARVERLELRPLLGLDGELHLGQGQAGRRAGGQAGGQAGCAGWQAGCAGWYMAACELHL